MPCFRQSLTDGGLTSHSSATRVVPPRASMISLGVIGVSLLVRRPDIRHSFQYGQ
nr:MAG TPA_asm: Protein of unknown function (DUF3767) [Caudoviricetes sp.]